MTDEPHQESEFATVEIYGQLYHLAGSDLERVRRLAARVDEQMRAVAAQGRTVDSIRVAVLAALNLADGLARAEERLAELTATEGSQNASAMEARARQLSGILDRILAGA
jgi:cell division protein ZapA